ncbi:MAG TPA: serine/threonine-protein kinase, partial [Planctomycetaceae bacterium]|nr:serine/threonine-protein kinase [Planctomycetaceae bacterium]
MELKQAGPWEIDKKLGAGGMGTVYLGKHKQTGQVAAIKVLPASLAREEGFIERFKREIVSMEKLKSPHIVEFFESGNDGDTYFYAMEYVEGETLTNRLKRDKRLPWPEVIDLCLQLCRALKAAHNAGIVHRDLKPSNLMMATDGTVKLTDFGVAQVFAERKLTVTGGIVGTAEYMSPEQAKGQRATKKSDLYSLGAVMYAMLTGRPPFSGKTSLDVIHKLQFAQFDRPGLIATDIPKQLEEIVCTLLEKDPDKRFPDAYVLSLRLIEVQKRFAWQSAAAKAPAPSSPSDSATEAGRNARPVEDDKALSPTVLIPDALRLNIPSGPTIASPAGQAAASNFPMLGVTATSPSARRGNQTSEVTREVGKFSQGPGTIMRNLMRRAIAEQQAGGTFRRVFDHTWVQVAALLFIIGGVWWYKTHAIETVTNPDEADKSAHQDGTATKLEQIESEVNKFVRLKESRGDPEAKRQLRQALLSYQLGDVTRAERTLKAVIALTNDETKVHDLAQKFLDALQSDRTDVTLSITEALKRAQRCDEKGQTSKAQQIWQAIIDLYADDPTVAVHVDKARQKLAASQTARNTPSSDSASPDSAPAQPVVPDAE